MTAVPSTTFNQVREALIAGIAALIVVVVFAFGGTIQDVFTNTCNEVSGGVNSNGGPQVGGC